MPMISVFPNWNTNPYLNMLFLEVRARGWAVSGGTKVVANLLKDIPRLRGGDILHVQWTSPFLEASKTSADYLRLVEQFVEAVTDAKRRGVAVLWTVHNLLAHEGKFADEEISLARALCNLADRIIVLNSHTVRAASHLYAIPIEKVVHIPHPSYIGIYAPASDRVEVRRTLGIPEGFNTMGIVGAIKRYKGIADFLESSRLVANRFPRTGVILAGETDASAMQEVDAHMPHGVPVFRRHSKLSDNEMAAWVSACDVMVLPYRGILNSGSMMLAASFGVPVALPRLEHLEAEYGEQSWISYFDASEDDATRWEAIAASVEQLFEDRVQRSRDAIEFARSNTLWDMTQAYADVVESVVR